MLRSIDIKDSSDTPIKWLPKVPFFKEPRRIEFHEGLNILWGNNGTGKSTLLQLLGKMFHCYQGGIPKVTQASYLDLYSIADAMLNSKKEHYQSLVIDHDGQPVRFIDPSRKVGVTGGSFDDDFFLKGVTNSLFKGSSGQVTLHGFEEIVDEVLSQEAPELTWSTPKRANIEAFLRGSGEKGPRTIILDEPDRSLDLHHQYGLWRFLKSAATEVQIIVASHSLFAADIAEANYIDLSGEAKYLDQARKCLKTLQTWREEPVVPLDSVRKLKPQEAKHSEETEERLNALRTKSKLRGNRGVR